MPMMRALCDLGVDYLAPGGRGASYPEGLVQRRELTYLAERLDTVEINGSFYSLQRPSSYRTWAERRPTTSSSPSRAGGSSRT